MCHSLNVEKGVGVGNNVKGKKGKKINEKVKKSTYCQIAL
jgi:hypothetical protein